MEKQEIFEALNNLVELKKWEDKVGKYECYLKEQQRVWKNAFKIVEREKAISLPPKNQLQQTDVTRSFSLDDMKECFIQGFKAHAKGFNMNIYDGEFHRAEAIFDEWLKIKK